MVVALATLAIAGCSHGTISSVPTAPAATIRSLTLTPVGGGTMIQGATAPITSSGPLPSTGATLGAFALYTDGSGKYLEAKWTSSDASVIAVDGVNFTAMGRGTATITASAEGRTANETFIVEPGIPGTWSGAFVVDQCGASSGSMNEVICFPPNQGRPAGSLAVGSVAPLTIVIGKSGSVLTASAQFGELRGVLTGIDRGANLLTFSGDLNVNTTKVTLTHWDSRVVTDLMEGFIAFDVRIAGIPGLAQVSAHFDKLTRR